MTLTKTITNLNDFLAGRSGGRVLDIATGRGGFACLLHDHLSDYEAIVGIDYHRHVLLEAYAQCLGPKTAYIQMEVTSMGFAPDSFDTVTASAALHHLEDAPAALREGQRALKSGGRFLLVEMHRDAKDGAQKTGVLLHHWASDVDAARGIYHLNTYSRRGLVQFIEQLELREVETYDLTHPVEDPHANDTIERLSSFIDRHLKLAAETDEYPELSVRADELKTRLNMIGVRREPVVAITGLKN